MNLYAASNGTSAMRGYCSRVSDGVDATLGRQHHERALGRVAHQLAVLGHRVGAQRHRQQVALERHVGGSPARR